MRFSLVFVWFLIIAQPAQADRAACRALFLNAPTALGGFAVTGRKDYEKSSRGAGYSVQFRKNESQIVSVFFFDRKQSRFSEKFLATELSVSASDIYRLRSEGKNVSDGDVYFDRADKPTRGLFGLSFVHLIYEGRVRQHDYITLGVVDGCMVKMIYSARGSKRAANRKFNQVLNDLLTHLNGTS